MKRIASGVHMPVMGFSSREKDFLSRKQILSFAQKAEFLGYDSLSVNDHIVFRTNWLDAISTLSAVAAITNKIKLGTSILNIVIRNPVVCAKALSAIDILSSGRLFAAGVGSGSHKGIMTFVGFLLMRDGKDLLGLYKFCEWFGMMWKGQNRGEPARNAAVKQFIQELHP